MNTDWLGQLAPAHAPPAIGWWPLAPGWWALGILLAAFLAALLYYFYRPQQRLRRAALRELARLTNTNVDDAALARDLAHLLRRYAVARFGREQISLMSGDAWIAFVVAHGGAELAGEAGSNMLRLAYGGRATADRARWLDGARAFLKDGK